MQKFTTFQIICLCYFLPIFFTLIGCNKTNSIAPESDKNKTVYLKSSEIYTYNTSLSGDEEGAVVKTHPAHFEISEIKRNAETNYTALYTFKPEKNYTGTDYVEIQLFKGSNGSSPSTSMEIIRINFVVE